MWPSKISFDQQNKYDAIYWFQLFDELNWRLGDIEEVWILLPKLKNPSDMHHLLKDLRVKPVITNFTEMGVTRFTKWKIL